MGKIRALLEQIDEAIAQENVREENRQDFTPSELMAIAEELNRSLRKNRNLQRKRKSDIGKKRKNR